MSSIVEIVTEDQYTGYGIATLLNRILKETGSVKEVRPQMMYNYLRNGMVVKGQKIFGESLRQVTKAEVIEFLERYCKRNQIVPISSNTNPDQMELDLQM